MKLSVLRNSGNGRCGRGGPGCMVWTILLVAIVFSIGCQGKTEKIWACLLHISMNMWKEKSPVLPFDDSLWNDALEKMAEVGKKAKKSA